MIHQIRSSLASFKTVTMRPGFNVLLAQRRPGARESETRNSVGKSSLIQLVHFLLGERAEADSLFRRPVLDAESFEMDFDLDGARATVSRTGARRDAVRVQGWKPTVKGLPWLQPQMFHDYTLKNDAWCELLGMAMFGLPAVTEESEKYHPSFRMLFGYFARRERDGGFFDPFRHAEMMQPVQQKVALSYLLQLDWRIPQEFQRLADQVKDFKAMKKAAKGDAFQRVMGNPDVLRSEIIVLDERIGKLARDLERFQVLPQYEAFEREADQLTAQLARIADEDVLDRQSVDEMQRSLAGEAPPDLRDLERLYRDAGVVLPDAVRQRYDDVRAFHESVVRNRKVYLEQEMSDARTRIETRASERRSLEARRAHLMGILRASKALDQYSAMQNELGVLRAERDGMQKRFDAMNSLSRGQDEVAMHRLQAQERLRRELDEQSEVLREIVLTFRSISESLYEDYGTLSIGEAPKGGLRFHIDKHGLEGKGIRNMQIFCFDMTLMLLTAKRGVGPGFLLHDSHLFDGVDERQVAHALHVGATLAERHGFQYLVTMNSDAVPKTFPEGFRFDDHVLDVRLTDAAEDGGLFGIRFD